MDIGWGSTVPVSKSLELRFSGWALGEHLEWAKYSNFRVATNVPMMIHVPDLTDYKEPGGVVSNALVELVDLFPTLAELTGIKVPGKGFMFLVEAVLQLLWVTKFKRKATILDQILS